MAKGAITKITKASTTTTSLRTTIPMGIVQQFSLKEGDKLDWSIEARGGDLIITVRKVRV